MASGDTPLDDSGRATPVVTIRAATLDDLPALGRLGTLLVQQHHDFDGARFIPAAPQTPAMYAKFLGSQIGNPDAVMLIAECDGEIVGYTYGGLEGFDYMSLRGPADDGGDDGGASARSPLNPARRVLRAGPGLLTQGILRPVFSNATTGAIPVALTPAVILAPSPTISIVRWPGSMYFDVIAITSAAVVDRTASM